MKRREKKRHLSRGVRQRDVVGGGGGGGVVDACSQ